MFFSRGQVNQIFAGLAVCLINISIGLCFAWTSFNIKPWLSPGSIVPMNVYQSSWVLSYLPIGCVLVVFPSGLLANYVGRKLILLASSPVLIVSWLIVIFTRSVEMLYLARFLQGAATGMVLTVSPLYLGEISDVGIRGFIVSFYFGAFFGGNLIEYVAGHFLSYVPVAYFNLSFPILFLIIFFYIPESPYLLMIKGDHNAVASALEWFRVGKTKTQIQEEIGLIENSVEVMRKSENSFKDIVTTHQARKALLIIVSTAVIRIFTGGAAVISLASYVFQTAGTSFFTPNVFAILVGAVQFIGFFFAAPSVDILGRRFLLLWSTLVCCICQIVVAMYFYFKVATDVPIETYSWIVPAALSVYFFFLAVGTGTIVGVLKNELFSLNTRGLASSIAGFAATIAEIISLKSYQIIATSIGIYWNHVIFVLFGVYGVLVYIFILPETKGRTFQEIQDLLAKKPSKKPSKNPEKC